jgi:hypothetical protein
VSQRLIAAPDFVQLRFSETNYSVNQIEGSPSKIADPLLALLVSPVSQFRRHFCIVGGWPRFNAARK